MDAIGKIYRISAVDDEDNLYEFDFLRMMLRDEGFRLQKSSKEQKITIHKGGDILSGNQYLVGFFDDGCVYAMGKSLDDFMTKYV